MGLWRPGWRGRGRQRRKIKITTGYQSIAVQAVCLANFEKRRSPISRQRIHRIPTLHRIPNPIDRWTTGGERNPNRRLGWQKNLRTPVDQIILNAVDPNNFVNRRSGLYRQAGDCIASSDEIWHPTVWPIAASFLVFFPHLQDFGSGNCCPGCNRRARLGWRGGWGQNNQS